mgnify:CR=1 FL=1
MQQDPGQEGLGPHENPEDEVGGVEANSEELGSGGVAALVGEEVKEAAPPQGLCLLRVGYPSRCSLKPPGMIANRGICWSVPTPRPAPEQALRDEGVTGGEVGSLHELQTSE